MFLDVKDLWLDVQIMKMVKSFGLEFPEEYEENVYDAGTFPLSKERLASVRGVKLPIDVKKSKGKGLYYILNGRHRVANCILEGRRTIEVNVNL